MESMVDTISHASFAPLSGTSNKLRPQTAILPEDPKPVVKT